MIQFYLRQTVVCDWANKKRACCADADKSASWAKPRTLAEIEMFEKRAKELLAKDGWHFGVCTLCPTHNTPAFRKKRSFPKPKDGSMAQIMREVFGD